MYEHDLTTIWQILWLHIKPVEPLVYWICWPPRDQGVARSRIILVVFVNQAHCLNLFSQFWWFDIYNEQYMLLGKNITELRFLWHHDWAILWRSIQRCFLSRHLMSLTIRRIILKYLCITMILGDLVKVKQRLIDILLQCKRCFHCIGARAPLIVVGFLKWSTTIILFASLINIQSCTDLRCGSLADVCVSTT